MRALRDADDEILFERRVALKQVDSNAKIRSFTDLVELSLAVDDYEFSKSVIGDDTALFVVAKVESPEFLNTTYFAEARHGAVMLLLFPKQGNLGDRGGWVGSRRARTSGAD